MLNATSWWSPTSESKLGGGPRRSVGSDGPGGRSPGLPRSVEGVTRRWLCLDEPARDADGDCPIHTVSAFRFVPNPPLGSRGRVCACLGFADAEVFDVHIDS